MELITPVAAALLLEVQDRARQHPDVPLLDLLAQLVQDRPPLPLERGIALAGKLNGFQVLTNPPNGLANLFMGLALPGANLYLVPVELPLARLALALVSPIEEQAVAMAQAINRSWDKIQAQVATLGAGTPATGPAGLVVPDGH